MSSLNICSRRNRRVAGGVTRYTSPHHHRPISELQIPGQNFKTTSLFILLLLNLCCLCCTWTVYMSLCCTYACPSTRTFVLLLGVPVYKSLCCAYACPSTRMSGFKGLCCEAVLHLYVSVYKSFMLHLDVYVYKSVCYTPVRICLHARALCCTPITPLP
jgi:hypothetical protein